MGSCKFAGALQAATVIHRPADRPDQDREFIDTHHRVGIFDTFFSQPLRLQASYASGSRAAGHG
jgi:hypothetical protein